MTKEKEFILAIREYIRYWDDQDRDSRGKLEGLSHSILVMLDGYSGNFDGGIEDIVDYKGLYHDLLYDKDI